MVCLGNICRSPLAEGILQSKLPKNQFLVDSAGTGAWHAGQNPDKRSIEVGQNHGIDISKQKARQFTKSDFETFDFIYVMDRSNYDNVIKLASNDNQKSKVRLILSTSTVSEKEVPDPYYGGEEGFEFVYQLLDVSCTEIANELLVSKK